MADVLELGGADTAAAPGAAEVLEAGGLVLLPSKGFDIEPAEQPLLDPDVLDASSKNVSLDPTTGRLGGTNLQGERHMGLTGMMQRYSTFAEALVQTLLPDYAPALQKRRASYRPGAIATRALSPRKDDRRLHVDAFPANPVQGRRILRTFTNIDPRSRSRVWNVGEEDFATFAERFGARLKSPPLASGWALQALGVTKGRRTPYDQAMLDLHDRAKLDEAYQRIAPRQRLEFAAGATWIVYTDAVLHAALEGQHCLEHTFLLPVVSMQDERRSPLRVLERLTGRRLV